MTSTARRVRNLLNRACPGTVILCYHRVAELAHDPFEIAVTPATFEEHLQVIRATGRPARLGEAVGCVGRPGSSTAALRLRRRIVVTFDDGYADNLHAALPALQRQDVPATVFLASGYLGGHREFWWDELERWTDGAPARRRPRLRRLHAALGRVAPARRRRALDRLWTREGLSSPPPVRPAHRPLDGGEAVQLARSPLIAIGGHTIDHSMLPPLRDDRVLHDEVAGCRRQLADLLGRPPDAFAYPFGWHDDRTVAAVRTAGFTSAVTIVPIAAHPRAHPFRVPRLMVGRWDAEELARQLRRAFTSG